jgi:flavin-dependent dehydrogenase
MGPRRAWEAQYLVDASGRDTFLGNRLHSKRRNKKHNSAAIYAHFTGARRASRQAREGNISIFWFDHGWFWFIPLADGATSVGAVVWPRYLKTRETSVEEFFSRRSRSARRSPSARWRASLAGEVRSHRQLFLYL